MRKRYLLVLLGLLLLVLSACGQPATNAPTEQSGEPVPEATSSPAITAPSDNSGAQPVALVEEPVDYCLECHTDKQRLIDTADEEQEVISENSGEG